MYGGVYVNLHSNMCGGVRGGRCGGGYGGKDGDLYNIMYAGASRGDVMRDLLNTLITEPCLIHHYVMGFWWRRRNDELANDMFRGQVRAVADTTSRHDLFRHVVDMLDVEIPRGMNHITQWKWKSAVFIVVLNAINNEIKYDTLGDFYNAAAEIAKRTTTDIIHGEISLQPWINRFHVLHAKDITYTIEVERERIRDYERERDERARELQREREERQREHDARQREYDSRMQNHADVLAVLCVHDRARYMDLHGLRLYNLPLPTTLRPSNNIFSSLTELPSLPSTLSLMDLLDPSNGWCDNCQKPTKSAGKQ
jgi:hypothetical protein